MKIFFISIISVLFFYSALCADFGPVYENNDCYSHILNPLIQRFSENSEIRLPLYRSEKKDNSVIREIIFPVFTYISNEYKTDYQLLGLFKYTDYKGHIEKGRTDRDLFLFPCILKGKDNIEGDYFAVVPFGGNIRGKLGKDEIKFIMLPIYMQTRYKQIEIEHYLYPLIAYSNKSEDYSLFKIFPFYSSENKKGASEKTIMWPFYKTTEKIIYKKNDDAPTILKSYYVFPFYAVERMPHAEYKSYLYPLIKYKVDAPDEYISIFPLFERLRSDNYSKDSFMYILYNRTKTSSKNNLNIIYPLLRIYSDTAADELDFYMLPLFKYRRSPEVARHQVFPLYKYSKYNDGSVNLNILSFDLFLKDTSIEKNYSRYWRIINYYRQNAVIDVELLFSVVRYRKNNDKSDFSLFPLFSVKTEPENRHINLFCGLLGFDVKR